MRQELRPEIRDKNPSRYTLLPKCVDKRVTWRPINVSRYRCLALNDDCTGAADVYWSVSGWCLGLARVVLAECASSLELPDKRATLA